MSLDPARLRIRMPPPDPKLLTPDELAARGLARDSRQPHMFETGEEPACARCRATMTHPVHVAGMTRTRVVVSMDHARLARPADVEALMVEALGAATGLVLVDLQVLR